MRQCLYSDWFELDRDDAHMLVVADVEADRWVAVKERERALFDIEKPNIMLSEISAVMQVDHAARVLTAHRRTNPRFFTLIEAFNEPIGCPVNVNISFDVRGEPIVCRPEIAFRSSMETELDRPVVGNCVLGFSEQDQALMSRCETEFELE